MTLKAYSLRNQKSTLRLPGLSLDFARDGLRNGEPVEPKAWAYLSTNSRPRANPRGSGLTLSGASLPALKTGFAFDPIPSRGCTAERVKQKQREDFSCHSPS